MQRKLMFLFIFFPVICFPQNQPISPEIIEQVCKNSEVSAINALATLSARTNNFKDLTLEKIKNSYVESMNDERERIKSIVNTSTYQIILDSADENFKYALCQKLSRPTSSISVIASELYFLCRKNISTRTEQKPPPCF
jgi:hypothetical protein